MNIKTNDKEMATSLILSKQEKKAYIKLDIIDDTNQEIVLQDIPSIFFDNCQDNIHEYTLFLLKKHDLKENDIFSIYFDKKERSNKCTPSAVLIPVTAIEAENHDFADKSWFWRYSNVALQTLFTLNLWTCHYNINIDQERIYLSELLGEDTAFLIIHRKKFDIADIFSSIIRYGFFLQEKNISPIPEYFSACEDLPDGKYLTLSKISPDLEKVKFQIFNILKLYVHQSNNIFKFFILYQIIEILMQEIFDDTKNELLKLLAETTDIQAMRDLLNDHASEKQRFRILVDNYVNRKFKDEDLKILKDACKYYLNLDEKMNKKMNNFQECIYKVRNSLFHNLRLHDGSRDGHLKQIVDELMKIMPDILFSYKKPNFQKPDFK